MASKLPDNTNDNLLGGGSYAEGERLQGEAQAEAAPTPELSGQAYAEMLNKYLGPKGLSVLIALGIPKPTEGQVRFLAFAAHVAGDNFMEVWQKLVDMPLFSNVVEDYAKSYNIQKCIAEQIKELCPVTVEGKVNGQ